MIGGGALHSEEENGGAGAGFGKMSRVLLLFVKLEVPQSSKGECQQERWSSGESLGCRLIPGIMGLGCLGREVSAGKPKSKEC